jgi:hypothetical protein
MIFMIFLTVSIATEPEALGLALIGVLPDRGTKAMIRTVKGNLEGSAAAAALAGAAQL